MSVLSELSSQRIFGLDLVASWYVFFIAWIGWLTQVSCTLMILLFFQDASMMPVTACLIVIFCQLCRIPISWRKCEIGSTIRWIGWNWNLSVGYVYLPTSKLEKIKSLIDKLSHSDRTSRKTIEQFLGLAMWITQLFPSMRTWLHSLYHDLYSIPASNSR